MIRIVLRRALAAVPVLFGVLTISFCLLAFIPGDPVDIMLGDQATTVDKEALRHTLELDRPVVDRYFSYLTRLAHGDLGVSLTDKQSNSKMILERAQATFELALAALLLAAILGVPLGTWAAIRRDQKVDHTLRALSLIAASSPSFWIAPALVYVFALRLSWLPVSERGGFDHLILPSVTLAFGLAAVTLEITRASMLEVLHEDYITVARAKGARTLQIYFRHALANAATPIVTVLALQAGAVLTGTVIVESIFDWPGLGTLLFQAISRRDFPLVQATVMVIAVITMCVQLIADLALLSLDPRART